MQSQIPTLVKHLSDLALLASCIYLSTPLPDPKKNIAPVVLPDAISVTERQGMTAELREFADLPPQLQRQVLEYARKWLDANFEKVE